MHREVILSITVEFVNFAFPMMVKNFHDYSNDVPTKHVLSGVKFVLIELIQTWKTNYYFKLDFYF